MASIFYSSGTAASQIRWSLSLLFLLLIVFLRFRLRTLGLCDRGHLFLLHWLTRLVSRFLLRARVLRIDILWFAFLLIRHFLLLRWSFCRLLVIGEFLQYRVGADSGGLCDPSRVQLCDGGQQLAGQMILGDESVNQVQRLLWNIQGSGEQDDWR